MIFAQPAFIRKCRCNKVGDNTSTFTDNGAACMQTNTHPHKRNSATKHRSVSRQRVNPSSRP